MAIESFDKKKMGICIDLALIAFESLAKQPQPTKTLINSSPVMTEPHIPTIRKLFHWIAWSGIVIGTLIWGYGDLLFE